MLEVLEEMACSAFDIWGADGWAVPVAYSSFSKNH